jgi:4-hydroxy-2-oxoheptanedioate aldolase
MRSNQVKRLLRAGRPAIGTWLGLGSPVVAEQLAHLGFDWLVIDQEHGAIDASLTLSLLQAISTTETVPLVRVPSNEAAHIRRALDAGAYGVVVPMVNTVEEAKRAVRAARYPPQGDRGVGGARPRLYGGPDYLAHANEEMLVIVQLERLEAVRNVRDILSVQGVDAWLVGPNDLCASLGLPPANESDAPEFREALAAVRLAARTLGVPGGVHAGSAETARQAMEQGDLLVSVGSDVSFLEFAASGVVRALGAGGPRDQRSGSSPELSPFSIASGSSET